MPVPISPRRQDTIIPANINKTKNNRKMKKLLLIAVLATASLTAAQAQLLYKISGKDLQKPSYVIGTHHLANVGFVEKITGVKDALTETEQVYGEVVWDHMMNPDSLKVLQKAMMLPDGQTLKTLLTDEQYKKLDGFLTKYMGVGLKSPQVEAQMGSMSPAALTSQLQVLLFLQNHMGEFDPSSTFDQYFQAQAKKNNEPVGGLETLSFQIGVLYQSTSPKRQAEQLMCLIDNEQFYMKMLDNMTDAFYKQNLDGLKKVMDEKLASSCDSTPEEEAALIDNRNADWAAKMPAIMSDKPTFFAVGAGHLPGEKGLLRLLTDAGYTVEAVQ